MHPAYRPRAAQRQSVDAFLHPAAVGFVFGLIGFVFDIVKSPIDTPFRSKLNNRLILRLEHVFPKLASFGAFHDSQDWIPSPVHVRAAASVVPWSEDENRASDNEYPAYKNDLHKPRSSCQKKKGFVLSEWHSRRRRRSWPRQASRHRRSRGSSVR
jgi:hypothetical protein